MIEQEGAEARAVERVIGAAPNASVIWLHGLGADGHDFEPILPELALPADLSLRFVFPHAPYRPVSINNGYVMRAWYDMAVSDRGIEQNLEHVRASVAQVHGWIKRETGRGIPPGRVVLAGFSQGGAIVLHAGLTYPRRLAGIAALSAPLPAADALVRGLAEENRDTPVFMAHGVYDTVVPFEYGRQGMEALRSATIDVQWREYAMAHSVSAQEIGDIAAFLAACLGRQKDAAAGNT